MEEIELINLELEEIRKATNRLYSLKSGFENINKNRIKEGKDKDETCCKLIDRDNNFIDYAERTLNGVCNTLWDYLNGEDAITGVDIALSKVPMELINRTKEEKDYE